MGGDARTRKRGNMKKILSRLTLALVVALVVSLGVAIPAMAAETPPEPLTPIQVGITKEILMPPGTTTPASTFTFTFTQMVPAPIVYPATESDGFVIGSTTPAATLSDRTINFAAGAPNVDQWWSGAPDSAGRHGNILDGATWPHAGVFTFLVRETANTNTAIAANPSETMTYDDRAFILRVQVSNCVATNTLVPTIAVLQRGTPGTEGRWVETGDKLDYEPGTPGTDDQTLVVDPSDMRFVNNFVRDHGDATNPALTVSKVITNDANFIQADLTTHFNFTLTLTAYAHALPTPPGGTVTLPGSALPDLTLPANAPVIRNAANAIVPSTERNVVVTGNVITFDLRHDERLELPTLPAGTTWEVTEGAIADFTPSVAVHVGSATPTATIPGTGVNTSLSTNDRIIHDNPAPAVNLGAFSNAYSWSPITGLIVGSMPILVVLIGATLVLAMMVASRSRSRIEQVPVF